jgi:hypothetical protein
VLRNFGKDLEIGGIIARTIKTHEIIIMALQPTVGFWPLSQFLDPIHSRQDSLDGGSARRKAATCTQDNTDTE